MRPFSPSAFQAIGSADQPAPAAARLAGIPIAAAIAAGASSDSASIEPSIRGTSPRRSAHRPCTLWPPIVPANWSKSSVAG